MPAWKTNLAPPPERPLVINLDRPLINLGMAPKKRLAVLDMLDQVLTKRWHRIVAGLLLTALGVAVALFAVWIFSRGALSRRDEWATLQAAEYAHRNSESSGEPLLLENADKSGLTVLGLPGRDPACNPRCPFIWLALNRDDVDGGPMIVPPGARGRVSCSYVRSLELKLTIASAADEWLRSRCRD